MIDNKGSKAYTAEAPLPPSPSTLVVTPAAPFAPAPAVTDMFGDMTIKSTPAPTPAIKAATPATAVDAAPAANGSAFGFMNASAVEATPSPAPATAAAEAFTSPTPSKETFDSQLVKKEWCTLM